MKFNIFLCIIVAVLLQNTGFSIFYYSLLGASALLTHASLATPTFKDRKMVFWLVISTQVWLWWGTLQSDVLGAALLRCWCPAALETCIAHFPPFNLDLLEKMSAWGATRNVAPPVNGKNIVAAEGQHKQRLKLSFVFPDLLSPRNASKPLGSVAYHRLQKYPKL